MSKKKSLAIRLGNKIFKNHLINHNVSLEPIQQISKYSHSTYETNEAGRASRTSL